MQIPDHDVQCLLCDRGIAEWRRGRLRLNPYYEHDARAALAARRCAYCGGRLVGFQVTANYFEVDTPLRAPRRKRVAG